MKNELTPELMEKAKAAKSAEELLSLAKENGIELTAERANAYFERINQNGELSDEELDGVAGGGCGKDHDPIVVIANRCDDWECILCGGRITPETTVHGDHNCPGTNILIDISCGRCKYGKPDGRVVKCSKT